MLDIRLTGTAAAIQQIDDQKQKLTDYREYFEQTVRPALFRRFAEIFEREGAVGGFPRWQQRRSGGEGPILQRTGRLYRAYTGRSAEGRIRISARSLLYENLVPYAIFHETGTRRGLPRRTVVARLLAYKEFRNDINTGLSRFLMGG